MICTKLDQCNTAPTLGYNIKTNYLEPGKVEYKGDDPGMLDWGQLEKVNRNLLISGSG